MKLAIEVDADEKEILRGKVRNEYSKGKTTCAVSLEFGISVATAWRWCKDIIRHNSEIDRKGVNNGNYTGGHINEDGYRIIYADGIRILEHRHVMEVHLGRKLESSEIIHHINSNKLDNRIENLMVTTISSHHKEHTRPWEKKTCLICMKLFSRPDYTSITQWVIRKTCSIKCRNKLHSLMSRGEGNLKSKLTEEDVLKIRNKNRDGVSLSKLSKEYNVTETAIQYIIKRKNWKHI